MDEEQVDVNKVEVKKKNMDIDSELDFIKDRVNKEYEVLIEKVNSQINELKNQMKKSVSEYSSKIRVLERKKKSISDKKSLVLYGRIFSTAPAKKE